MEYINIWILSDKNSNKDTEIVWMDEHPHKSSHKLLDSHYIPKSTAENITEFPDIDLQQKSFVARKLLSNEFGILDEPIKHNNLRTIKISYKSQEYILVREGDYSFTQSLKN